MRRPLAVLVAWLAATTAHAATFIVNVGGNSPPTFTPQTISISAGDTITFINKGGLHNAKADDGSFRCAQGCDGDGHSGSGASSTSNWVASVTFPSPGTIGYYCEQHGAPGQGMFGTIIVQPLVPVRLQSFDVD
jgi:plastocyanin